MRRIDFQTSARLLLASAILVWGAAVHAQDAAPAPVKIRVDAAKTSGTLDPIWTYFGYDEPNNTTTPEGKELLADLAKISPAPVYIRAHNLLTTGDGTTTLKWGSTNVYTEDAQGNPVYDWKILDGIFDAYKEAGVKPFVELGFMPEALAEHPEPYRHNWPDTFTTGWASPPKDYAKWGELIYQVVKHMNERYGVDQTKTWIWEIWNEPDGSYWMGKNEQDWFKLNDYGVEAIRRALPGATISGPHVTGGGGADRWLRDFLAHCLTEKNYKTGEIGTPLDLVSWQPKGRPDMVNGNIRMGLGAQLGVIDRKMRILASNPAWKKYPVQFGEFDPEGLAANSMAKTPANAYRVRPLYASYTLAALKGSLDLANNYGLKLHGALSWAFTFPTEGYFQGYRELATHTIHLPVFNAFEMLGRMKGDRLEFASDAMVPAGQIVRAGVRGTAAIDGFATRDGKQVSAIVWNYHDLDVAVPDSPISLTIEHLPAEAKQATVTQWRIDKTHSDAYPVWEKMGSPQPPTAEQVAELKKAGQLQKFEEDKTVAVKDGNVDLNFNLPREAVSLFEVKWE